MKSDETQQSNVSLLAPREFFGRGVQRGRVMDSAMQDSDLPDVMPSTATLYLTVPQQNGKSGVLRVLSRSGLAAREPFAGVLAVDCTPGRLHELSAACSALLSSHELERTKCRLSIGEPSTAELMQSQSLERFCAWIDGQWLGELLRSRRLATYFQPIVYATSPETVFAHECLLRGTDDQGGVIPPVRLFAAARATDQLHALDRAARLTAIESAARLRLSTYVFMNFNPRSIDDPVRCLESTVRATISSGLGSDRFVFEVVESEEINDVQSLLEILDFCRDAGCRVALDDLGAGYSSLNLLAQLKPDFIKLDVDLIRNVDADPYKSRVAAKLLELAQELNVSTVVEGVETVGEWQWATEHGADYAQGYLFARPQPVPHAPHFPRVENGDEPQTGIDEETFAAETVGGPNGDGAL